METLLRAPIEIIVSGAISIIAMMLASASWIAHSRLKKTQRELEQLVQSLRHEMNGLYNASAGIGERLQKIEQKKKTLTIETQESEQAKDSTHPEYQNALDMLRKGESLEHIAEVCGLSRGEVDLICVLSRIEYRQQQPS